MSTLILLPRRPGAGPQGQDHGVHAMVPVRLTVVAQDDIEAVGEAVGALARRDRRAHEAHDQGGVLSELDLSLLTGYTDGGVCAAVVRLRKAGEILPIRGYVADMGPGPPTRRPSCGSTWSA